MKFGFDDGSEFKLNLPNSVLLFLDILPGWALFIEILINFNLAYYSNNNISKNNYCIN